MNTFLGATGITAGDSVALLAPPTLAAADPEQAPTPDDSLRHSTIAHYLDAAAIPYVSAELISRDAISHIRRIGALLPGALTDFFGFECPLGTHEAKADFLICSRASEGGRDVLAGQRPSRELPAFLERHPVWQRVRDFSRDWSDSQSPLFEAIHNLWVEFDVDGMPPAIPVPSVFVGSEALRPTEAAADPGLMPRHCAWLLDRALPLLIGRDVDGPTRCQVARCLNLLPAEARIFQVGLMLARASRITRLCVRGVSSKQIPEYLQALGWEGSFPELEGLLKSLAPLVERIDLDMDVRDRVLPKIGLECYPAMTAPARPFLDHLVLSGLSTAAKAEALLRWSGMVHQRVTRDVWPRDLLSLSAFLDGRVHSTFLRWLHHIKVVYEPGFPLQAKAYLAVKHQWVTPGEVKQWLNSALALALQTA